MKILLSLLFVAAVVSCDPKNFVNEERNYFEADCNQALQDSETCVITHIEGYSGGSVTCTKSKNSLDGNYVVVRATNTPTLSCSGMFPDQESVYHFSADCSSATDNGQACRLTVSRGYSGGSVTCDTSDGDYDVVPASLLPPETCVLGSSNFNCDGGTVLSDQQNCSSYECLGDDFTANGPCCVTAPAETCLQGDKRWDCAFGTTLINGKTCSTSVCEEADFIDGGRCCETAQQNAETTSPSSTSATGGFSPSPVESSSTKTPSPSDDGTKRYKTPSPSDESSTNETTSPSSTSATGKFSPSPVESSSSETPSPYSDSNIGNTTCQDDNVEAQRICKDTCTELRSFCGDTHGCGNAWLGDVASFCPKTCDVCADSSNDHGSNTTDNGCTNKDDTCYDQSGNTGTCTQSGDCIIENNNNKNNTPASDVGAFMKGHCVNGQATDIPDMKAGGVDLVIPSDGYCMNLEPSSSMMLTCDGKVNLLFLDPLRNIF